MKCLALFSTEIAAYQAVNVIVVEITQERLSFSFYVRKRQQYKPRIIVFICKHTYIHIHFKSYVGEFLCVCFNKS